MKVEEAHRLLILIEQALEKLLCPKLVARSEEAGHDRVAIENPRYFSAAKWE